MRRFFTVAWVVTFQFFLWSGLASAFLDLTAYPGAVWEFSGGGSNPVYSRDGDLSTAWTASYNSHERGNIDFAATLTFPNPVEVDSVGANMNLKTSCRSFQAGGSNQGRSAVAQILYRTFGSTEFVLVPDSAAYDRVEVKESDGESTLNVLPDIAINLHNVAALRWMGSVASCTNEANAADGSIAAYEFKATGVPEPTTFTTLAVFSRRFPVNATVIWFRLASKYPQITAQKMKIT